MKGPCRWKAPRIVKSPSLSREVGHGGLGVFLTLELRASESELVKDREGGPPARRKREMRQGCQRLDRIGRRGKKTPTPSDQARNNDAREEGRK